MGLINEIIHKKFPIQPKRFVFAAHTGDLEVVKNYLKYVGEVDVSISGDYNYALTAAALSALERKGQIEVIKTLIEAGADLYVENEKFGNILMIAVRQGDLELVDLLVKHGMDINAKCKSAPFKGLNAFWLAIARHKLDIAEYLLKCGAKISAEDGAYCLNEVIPAAHQKAIPSIKFLHGYGIDINVPNHEGTLPIIYASYCGEVEVVKCLIDLGADVNKMGKPTSLIQVDKATALLEATNLGHISVVKVLLEQGADPRIKASNGKTPMVLATEAGKNNIANLLQRAEEKLIKKEAELQKKKQALIKETEALLPPKLLEAYATLELTVGASTDEMKQAYKDLLAFWHPDKAGTNERRRLMATEKTQKIIESYQELRSFIGF
ncbi:ankyrin repeat domain-containing protein [Deltaproteobacteria bacterium TL4]